MRPKVVGFRLEYGGTWTYEFPRNKALLCHHGIIQVAALVQLGSHQNLWYVGQGSFNCPAKRSVCLTRCRQWLEKCGTILGDSTSSVRFGKLPRSV
jgi:hypothetical protein